MTYHEASASIVENLEQTHILRSRCDVWCRLMPNVGDCAENASRFGFRRRDCGEG
jgi:hypothetical protein